MRHEIFCIRDNKSNVYNLPFFCNSLPAAIRNVSRAVMDETTQLNAFPQDFDLFKLGEYDDEQGKFIIQGNPEFVQSLVSIKAAMIKLVEKINEKEVKDVKKSEVNKSNG